jgi:hypothetical protein
MAKAIKVYDYKNVALVIATIPIDEGLGDPFISIEYDDDDFEFETAIDGQVTRYKKPNTMATATLTLKGTSVHNTQLSALRIADITDGSGAGIGVFYLKDDAGTLLMQAAHCSVLKPPTVSLGSKMADQVWTFKLIMNPAQILGGS